MDLRTITLGVPPQEVKIMNKDTLSTLNNDNKQEGLYKHTKILLPTSKIFKLNPLSGWEALAIENLSSICAAV